MFESYSLAVVDEEDLTKNIEYAKKLIAKEKGECEMRVYRWLKERLGKLLAREVYEDGKQFKVFILEKNHNQGHNHS